LFRGKRLRGRGGKTFTGGKEDGRGRGGSNTTGPPLSKMPKGPRHKERSVTLIFGSMFETKTKNESWEKKKEWVKNCYHQRSTKEKPGWG